MEISGNYQFSKNVVFKALQTDSAFSVAAHILVFMVMRTWVEGWEWSNVKTKVHFHLLAVNSQIIASIG